jgi:hypothetical protein
MNTIELNAEIYRQLGYLSDDKSYLEKALEMLRGLTQIKSIAQVRSREYTEMLERLSDFQDYEQGWDGEDAAPLDKTVIRNFKDVLKQSEDKDLKGWVLFPERNGTLFLQNEQHDAGINIGSKDFSYFINKDGKVIGENTKSFTPNAVIETIKRICA